MWQKVQLMNFNCILSCSLIALLAAVWMLTAVNLFQFRMASTSQSTVYLIGVEFYSINFKSTIQNISHGVSTCVWRQLLYLLARHWEYEVWLECNDVCFRCCGLALCVLDLLLLNCPMIFKVLRQWRRSMMTCLMTSRPTETSELFSFLFCKMSSSF